ncbi:hypothetical protein [Phenylobacterium sp.]|uniref:hypothetical protein n=1 Tax=Phenylobacterium sp. TaxID=1871053 RepID=UPI0011F6F9BC|nr:hypothetical protein [Phenylobacterium sp.]THD63656.1 MAG: hypothetical protein E8A49_04665 [Phenylobacterium sp.]
MRLNRLSILAAAGALAVAAAAGAAPYKAPRTPDGQPDLQGDWSNATITPFERDAKYGDRLALTDQEVKDLENGNAKLVADGNKPTDPNAKVTDLPTDCGRGFTGVNCGYNSAWVDPGTRIIDMEGVRRDSILVSPANGRLPPMKPEAQAQMRARLASAGGRGGTGAADNPEGRSLGERCLMSFGSSAGPPMLPLLYNNNYQIVQTKDEIAIDVEMVHDVRHIHLTGGHIPANMKLWMGDSIGHWEGDTLVVETTNMRPEQNFRGASMGSKIVERFTRVSPTQIKYAFTVDDPQTYTAPYTGEVALNATKGPLYEYACHEGNYALPGILAGARQQEKEALASGKPAAPGGGGTN